jgi:hypothetical protein
LRVQATKPPAPFDVTCDGDRIAGHAGAALLVELADRLGLTAATVGALLPILGLLYLLRGLLRPHGGKHARRPRAAHLRRRG